MNACKDYLLALASLPLPALPLLYLGGDRSVLNKTAQPSAKLSPFQSLSL